MEPPPSYTLDGPPPYSADAGGQNQDGAPRMNPVHQTLQGQNQQQPGYPMHQGQYLQQQMTPMFGSDPIKICVKTLTGAAFPLQVYPNQTVYQLKQELEQQTDLQAESQCLIFAGKSMEDGQLLGVYQISHEATIALVSSKPARRTGTGCCTIV